MYLYICVWIFLFGYFSPSSANKCWAICHQGPRCTTATPVPPLPPKRADALKHTNTQEKLKCANVQIRRQQAFEANARNKKKIHNRQILLFGGKRQVGDLLSIRKPSAVIPVSPGRIYFIIRPPHLHIWTNIFGNLDKYILKLGQIHFEIGTNTL